MGSRIRNLSAASLVGLMLVAMTASPLFAAQLTVRDKLGRTVTVDTPVKRAAVIVLYEILPVMAVFDQVIALSRSAGEDGVVRAAEGERAVRLACLGGGFNVNMEELMRLKPDVVLTWTSYPQQVSYLQRQGLKVIAVYPDNVSELYDGMRLMGRLFGQERPIEAAIRSMQALFDFVRQRVARIAPAKRQRVLWISTRPTSVSTGSGINNDIIRRAGGINVAGQIKSCSMDVSLERIIEWNPEVIFISERAPYSTRSIITNPQWRRIKAVRAGRVYKAPNWSTWSPMLAPTVLWMATRIYPERFRDIDLNARTDQFCRAVYGIGLAAIGGFVD